MEAVQKDTLSVTLINELGNELGGSLMKLVNELKKKLKTDQGEFRVTTCICCAKGYSATRKTVNT